MDAGSPVEGAKRKLSVDERRQRTMSKHQVSKMRALFEKYLTGQVRQHFCCCVCNETTLTLRVLFPPTERCTDTGTGSASVG